MFPTPIATFFNEIISTLMHWAHAIAAVGTIQFDGVVMLSLGSCIIFAVVALHYALKPWADKVMLVCTAVATAASLVLHLSIRHSPHYLGEGQLWKFAVLVQYLPWIAASGAGIYLIYRIYSRIVKGSK